MHEDDYVVTVNRMLDKLVRETEQKKAQQEDDRLRRKHAKYEPCYITPSPNYQYTPSRILNTPDEKINYKTFYAVYTPTYTHTPQAYLEGMDPIYSASPNDQDTYGALTIAGMLDLLAQGSSFRLCRMSDAYVARDIIDEYLNMADTLVGENNISNPLHRNRIKALKSLRAKMEDAIDRYEVGLAKNKRTPISLNRILEMIRRN